MSKLQCKLCTKKLSSSAHLEKHLKTIHKPKLFTCDFDGKNFNSKDKLRLHMFNHRKYYIVKCEVCDREYKTDQSMRKHLRTHFQQHQCDHCGQVFSYKRLLENHIAAVHEDLQEFQCKFCTRLFPNTTTRDNHQKLIHKDREQNTKVFKCTECPAGFEMKEELRLHSFIHYNGEIHTCLDCNQIFKKKKLLTLHMKKHEVPGFSCENCKQMFKYKSNLNKHLKRGRCKGNNENESEEKLSEEVAKIAKEQMMKITKNYSRSIVKPDNENNEEIIKIDKSKINNDKIEKKFERKIIKKETKSKKQLEKLSATVNKRIPKISIAKVEKTAHKPKIGNLKVFKLKNFENLKSKDTKMSKLTELRNLEHSEIEKLEDPKKSEDFSQGSFKFSKSSEEISTENSKLPNVNETFSKLPVKILKIMPNSKILKITEMPKETKIFQKNSLNEPKVIKIDPKLLKPLKVSQTDSTLNVNFAKKSLTVTKENSNEQFSESKNELGSEILIDKKEFQTKSDENLENSKITSDISQNDKNSSKIQTSVENCQKPNDKISKFVKNSLKSSNLEFGNEEIFLKIEPQSSNKFHKIKLTENFNTNIEISDKISNYDENSQEILSSNVNNEETHREVFDDSSQNSHQPRTYIKRKSTRIFKPSITSPYQCDICGFEIHIKSKFLSHIRLHISSVKHKCKECFETFKSMKNLHQHSMKIHNRGVFGSIDYSKFSSECKICGKILSSERMKSHMALHESPKVICDHCGKIYRTKIALDRHLSVVMAEKKFTCSICGKNFKKMSILKQHEEIHNPIKIYIKCEICAKILQMKHLKMHMEVQHGNRYSEKNFQCHCGKEFRYQKQLDKHNEQVHEAKNRGIFYSCSECERIFTRRQELRNHSFLHYSGAVFECSICGLKFKKKKLLYIHSKVHNAIGISFDCDECQCKFKTKGGLRKHKIKMHTKNDFC